MDLKKDDEMSYHLPMTTEQRTCVFATVRGPLGQPLAPLWAVQLNRPVFAQWCQLFGVILTIIVYLSLLLCRFGAASFGE